jgi:hypothetical protein
MRTTFAIIILIGAAVTVVYVTQRTRPQVAIAQTAPLPPTVTSAAPASGRQSKSSAFVSTDAHDPEFAQNVQPVIRKFFAMLNRAGVNPLKGHMEFNKVQIRYGPNGMGCRFLIGDSWTATTYIGEKFSGVLHFGERGPDNPFRAISDGDTNALMRLAERAIKMPQAEAERIIRHISDSFGIDYSQFEEPEIYPEQMFHYDLGMYTVQYRKKGSDPINRLNYPITFSIRATSPTTAVLVMYSYSGQGGIGGL